jgi:hypothetical protein
MAARAARNQLYDSRSRELSHWMDGFITAYNSFVHPSGNVFASSDYEEINAWLDRYCQQDPTKHVYAAVLALIEHFNTR